MPFAQVLCSYLNETFGPGEVDSRLEERLRGGEDLAELAGHLLADVPDRVRGRLVRYLSDMPSAMEAALKGVLVSNLDEDKRRPVTFAWAPGYDWEMTVWDVADGETRGGITVLVRSRYPDDPSPVRT
jgi:hypothetical protein